VNVTPTEGMYKAMDHLVTATVGDQPGNKETSSAAHDRRQARRQMFDILHNLVRLSMRIGVARFCEERGIPVVKDSIEPDPVAKAVREDAPVSNVIAIGR
jgi:hypothetical protein